MLLDLGGFVLGGAEVAQRGVQPLSVVEHLDEVEHGSAGLGRGGPRVPVDQLGLEGGEEAFGDGVVPGLAGTLGALGDAVSVEQPAVLG